MDKPIEPADVDFDALGVRLHVLSGYWVTLSPVRARALAYKILKEWPERPEPVVEVKTGDFYRCQFCKCNTNAHVRACCELGRATDLEKVTPEQLARWEEEAEHWTSQASRHPFGASEPFVRMLAGRVLVLLDELVRRRRKTEAAETSLRKVTVPMPVLTRGWLEDLSAVIDSKNLAAARTMIVEAAKVSTMTGAEAAALMADSPPPRFETVEEEA